ncbi:MAG: class I SAM-dependent methyltransferase [Spirochaetes bacterium]|nr:class I SAM-dependent methyltransferase [Spirochaetota bacterium]
MNRLIKNEKALRKWARKEGIEALRLYDADIPEIPLAIERFGLGSSAALAIWLYERPYEKDYAEESAWLELMARTAAEALDVPVDHVFPKLRKKMKGSEQYEKKAAGLSELIVKESGLSFKVNLSDYLDTGLFLDHRPARAAVGRSSRGKRLLNLFSYTGSFSVHAASGGATEVLSVDLSNTYHEWARANFALNGIPSSAHEEVKVDCLEFIESAVNARKRWDIIVVDPPTFSNSSMAKEDFDLVADWPRLLRACVRILAEDGTILFSTNSRKLRFDPAVLGLAWKDVSETSLPRDFRDRRIHRCWLLGNCTGLSFS